MTESVQNIIPEAFYPNDDPDYSFIYVVGGNFPADKLNIGRLIEVRIKVKDITSENRCVYLRQLWGGEQGIYTDDSDIVAMLHHSGHLTLLSSIPTNYIALSVIIKVLKPLDNYPSLSQYGILSRSLHATYHRTSIKIEHVDYIKKSDKFDIFNVYQRKNPRPSYIKNDHDIVLRMSLSAQSSSLSNTYSNDNENSDENNHQDNKKENHKERTTMESRADRLALRNEMEKRRKLSNIALVYNSLNQPAYKYDLNIINDSGHDEKNWTAYKLKTNYLIFETYDLKRYEIKAKKLDKRDKWYKYIFSSIKDNLDQYKPILYSELEENQLKMDYKTTIIHNNLDWFDFTWNNTSVTIKDKVYHIANIQFIPK